MTIRDILSKSYIVEVEKSTSFKTDKLGEWYLPHHPVFHPHKPGKVRGVLNGSGKFHGISLMNALFTGLELLQNLFHVLLRSKSLRMPLQLTLMECFFR